MSAIHFGAAETADEGATTRLARFTAETQLSDLPEPVTTRLRDCFLDFIGIAAFAARMADSSAPLRAGVRALDLGGGPATVLGEARGYSWRYAALLNGAYAHALDFDDTNQLQIGHPGAPVIAAALSEAERCGADGRAFLEALAVGYEVCCRIGAALGTSAYDRGFHITPVSGIFGAVAAVAKLRSLAPEVVSNAFGLALSKAAGSMQYLENGAWNKRLHPGFAAHDAMLCTTLAETGVVGAAAALEGRFGLLTGYTDAPDREILVEGLGQRWLLLETAIKPYPSCRLTHGAVDGALRLRAQLAPRDPRRASIGVSLSPTAMKIVGERLPGKLAPRNSVDAQFSVYFQVAAAWLYGAVDWSVYDRLQDEGIAALAQRITVSVDPTLPKAGARVVVELDGETAFARVETPLGEPEAPLGWDALERKFRSLAEPVYGERAGLIARRVAALTPATRIADIVGLLRTDTDP